MMRVVSVFTARPRSGQDETHQAFGETIGGQRHVNSGLRLALLRHLGHYMHIYVGLFSFSSS
jgi:hypothetical protein